MRIMGRRRLARTLVAVITISALSPACSSGDGDSTASSASPAVETPVGGTTPAERLASHLFLAAGDERGIEGYGELLEVIEFGDEPALSVTGDTIRGERGGTACLRFRYRPEGSENSVQTLCVVVFDEVGPCEGRPPLSLDLLAFLPSERDAGGNANLLESGAGRFYRACLGDGGRYRLQPTKSDLPPLYFHIVDALGDGPYS
ncbi:MAG: hypothetical protein ACE5EF_08240, partial [Dehalococcoidia bacterium]